MNNVNVNTWDKMYSEGRSLLIWPDEAVVAALNRRIGQLNFGIDIACGAGRHAILMSQMGINSIGIDSSDNSIKFAIKRAQELKLKNLQFYVCLVQDMILDKGSIDIAIVWGLIHYLEVKDQGILLDKVLEFLKPGGMLLATFRSAEDSRLSKGKLVEQNRYLVDYFDSGTKALKQTLMCFWDEKGVRDVLSDFSKINLGHRIVEPIGSLGNKSAHWLVEAIK
jgi:ubiquinone/menaquinone biosynthesis C-methylase UbiE